MKVIIACGGTGGHVFPAIGLAEIFKKNNIQTLFIGTKRDIEKQIKKRGYKLEILPITRVSFRSPIKCINSITGLIKSFFKAFKILEENRPDVVIGFGGYISVPVLLSAYFRKIPTVIHEQNAIPGKANYFLSKFAKKIVISFKESARYFKSDRVTFTGCPVRQEIFDIKREEALRLFNFDNNKFTILVMGGSQGSHKINRIFLETVSLFEKKDLFQIIHICGRQDYKFILCEYAKINILSRTFEFFERIGYAYSIADLVICRAGAATIAELISLGLASIIIPYPFGHIHQKENAKVLSDRGAAILIEETDLSAKRLKEEIGSLVENRDKLLMLRTKIKQLGVSGAANNLAKEILSLIEGDR